MQGEKCTNTGSFPTLGLSMAQKNAKFLRCEDHQKLCWKIREKKDAKGRKQEENIIVCDFWAILKFTAKKKCVDYFSARINFRITLILLIFVHLSFLALIFSFGSIFICVGITNAVLAK